MKINRIGYGIFCAVALVMGCNSKIKAENEKADVKKWTDRVIPLPHEVKVTGSVTVPVNKIKCSGKIKTPQQVVISKLLKPLTGRKKSAAVDIKLGLASDSELNVPKAIKERLGKLPNSDQAYAIVSSKQGGKLNVILTANTGYGLLYAVRTFSQMVKLPEKINPETKVEVPIVNVIDWPDIAERGQWGNQSKFFIPEFSELKLNLIAYPIRTTIDKNGNPQVADQKEDIKMAAEYGIKYVSLITHISTFGSFALAKVPYRKKLKHLLPALAKRKNGKPAPYPDFESKKMQELFAAWLTKLADATAPYHNIINIWLSEGEPGKYYTCKGHRVSYKIELDAVKRAFNEVKKKYPDLTMRLGISQGTRRAGKNNMIIDYCEKNNYGIQYYDGHKTYISDKNPMIFPRLTQSAAKGNWVGCLPQITNSWRTIVPMTSPQFVKFRCKEFADKKVSSFWGYTVPNKLFYEFNFAAMAEWTWNANGRTVEDFSRVYADFRNMLEPDTFAEWAVKEGQTAWSLAASNLMICLVHDPAMGFYGSIPFDYTYGGASKLKNVPNLEQEIKVAGEALELAEKLNNPDLVNESEFTYYALKAFKTLKALSKLIRIKEITAKEKAEIADKLNELDLAAHKVKVNALEWGARHGARQYYYKGKPPTQNRLLEAAEALLRTCDALRTVTACLRIPDPRPESRLIDIGEYSVKDFTRNKAKLRFDITKLVARNGGDYHVCFDWLEAKGLQFVMVSWVKLIGETPGEKPKVLSVSKDTHGTGMPRLAGNVPSVECSLTVPKTGSSTKLILEIDLTIWALGRSFPEEFPAKQRVCWGLISLRRVYGKGEFPMTGSKASARSKSVESAQKKIKICPKGKVIQVGITKGYNTEGLLESLKGRNDIHAFTIRRINRESLEKCNVLLVAQSSNPLLLNRSAKLLVDWIVHGGGIMFFHDGVGYRKHLAVFKDIGMGITHPRVGDVKVIKKHPVTKGIEIGNYFHPGYRYDHVLIRTGPKGENLAVSKEGRPVLVAGKLGKGRIVLNGMLTGWNSSEKSPRGSMAPAKGAEFKILLNSVKWLAN